MTGTCEKISQQRIFETTKSTIVLAFYLMQNSVLAGTRP